MSADTFTPTSMSDRGDTIVFYDVSGNVRQEPRYSDACALYLRRLGGAQSAELGKIQQETMPTPSVPSEYQVEADVSAGELLTLHSVPKTLVAAPGAGKRIRIVSATFYLDYNATAYADPSLASFVLGYKDASGAQMVSAPVNALVTATEDGVMEAGAPNLVSAGDDAVIWQNQPLVLYLTAAITTGDSPMRVKVVYQIDDTAL